MNVNIIATLDVHTITNGTKLITKINIYTE